MQHKALLPILDIVNECCSDDETDMDNPDTAERRPFKVRRLEWRSQKLLDIMLKIDAQRHKTRTCNNVTPTSTPATRVRKKNGKVGITPRDRMRHPNNPTNDKEPPFGLPSDCYDTEWVSGLRGNDKLAFESGMAGPLLDRRDIREALERL